MKSSGFHKLPILFFLSTLLFAGCEKPNTAPVADFSFSPASGAMDTLFTFDASGSSDTDDDISKLEVRWDWEADGVWDTDYSAVKTANHRFKDFADNYVILGVKDTKGLTASLKKPVSITDAATITGMDPRMCVCCGGWWICIRQDTLRFYDAPAAALAILEKATFPLAVHVKWTKKDPRCMGDEIIVLEMIIN